jgi:hypothetical protein
MILATGCGNASLAEATFSFITDTIVYKAFFKDQASF